jgi:hypothetical protein
MVNILRNAAVNRVDFNGLLDGYVPYTGATADLNLGTYTYIGHAVKANASDGLLIESSNGTDIGILGAGNTANVTWYGNHNFNNQTASTIAVFGASKTLSSGALANGITLSTGTLGLGDITPNSVVFGSLSSQVFRFNNQPALIWNAATPLQNGMIGYDSVSGEMLVRVNNTTRRIQTLP